MVLISRLARKTLLAFSPNCECTVVLARQQRFQYKEKQLVILREVVTRFLKTSFWFTAAAAGRAK